MDPNSALVPGLLVGLALGVGVVELLLTRGLLLVVSGIAHGSVVQQIALAAEFVRNVSAVLLVAGVATTTNRAMRSPRVGFGVFRRILLGMLSGVLFPVLGIALVMPASHTTTPLVLIGILAGYTASAVYALSAFDSDAGPEQRVASGVFLVFVLACLASFGLQIASGLFDVPAITKTARTVRGIVEFGYFGLATSLGIAALRARPRPAPLRIAWAILAAVAACATLVALDVRFPADTGLVLYGSLRLGVLDTTSPLAYGALFALAAGSVALALANRDLRRFGFGAGLVLLAGAGGGTPYSVAGVVLAAAAIGLVPSRERDSLV